MNEKITKTDSDLSSLNIKASLSGTWISPDIENAKGFIFSSGQQDRPGCGYE